MSFGVYTSAGQLLENQNPTGTAGGDLTGTYPNPTIGAAAVTASKLAAGSIVQVVEGSTNTRVDIASTTFTDTGLSASITPSSSSNKVLVLVSQSVNIERNTNAYAQAYLNIMRGSTEVRNFGRGLAINAGTASDGYIVNGQFAFISYLDSPSTTSATTYKTQGKVHTTSNTCSLITQYGATTSYSTMTLLEVRA